MTDKQPEALRLAEMMEDGRWQGMNDLLAAAELRRLHEVNAELVEALHLLVAAVDKDGLATKFQRWLSKADYALRKAQGENNAD